MKQSDVISVEKIQNLVLESLPSGGDSAPTKQVWRQRVRKFANATAVRVPPQLRALLPQEWKDWVRAMLSSSYSSEAIQQRIEVIRYKLFSVGFTELPLNELATITRYLHRPEARARAAHELALWHESQQTDADWRRALELIAEARKDASDHDFRCKLITLQLLCHFFLHERQAGEALYAHAVHVGEIDPNVTLAWVNFQSTPERRLAEINRVMGRFDITPLTFLPDAGEPIYDRLSSAVLLPRFAAGPKVTVLLAAFEHEALLSTALRALQEQTWQNLEIIVLGDSLSKCCSDEVVRHLFNADQRIRFIQTKDACDAFNACNRGLDEATGKYVTLHDAGNWVHPLRIERQLRFLEAHPDVMGCTSQQARTTSNLDFTRWTGRGQFIATDTLSFMFRRGPMKERLGYWDTVRIGSDVELIRRFRRVFGEGSVIDLETGPLSLRLCTKEGSTAQDWVDAADAPFGGIKQYVEAQYVYHASGSNMKYSSDPDKRPFPVPEILRKNSREFSKKRHFDVILGSELRLIGGSTQSNAQEIKCQRRAGVKSAIFPMARYDFAGHHRPIQPEIWENVDGKCVSILSYGEHVSCDLLILRYPPILQHRQRYIPQIDAKEIRVIVNQPPMSDYGPAGVVRYDLQTCARNLRHQFDKDAIWHPIGPLVREALHIHHADELHHIDLSSEDWHNIIDIKGWDRGPRMRGPGDRLRIGRHSRDHEHKWPGSRTEILAAYPACDDVEVHVLGGAEAPARRIGRLPANWTVHPFGVLHPREFLREIDVFVYFSHPDWIESFGRTIIEAMAVGVPVILPEMYRPLFGDGATYATPQTALAAARQLHADPVAYEEQVAKAKRLVAQRFSYETHLRRIGCLAPSSG